MTTVAGPTTSTPVAQPTNFKGNVKRTENGALYYKTSSGLKTGAVPAALLGAPLLLASLVPQDKWDVEAEKTYQQMIKNNQPITESLEQLKAFKKRAPLAGLAFAGLSLGCGAFVDYMRNQKAKKAADLIAKKGIMATEENSNINMAENGRLYYRSNEGLKWGALLGVAFHTCSNLVCGSKITPAKLLSGALTGLVMGVIADSITNKNAKKY